MPLVRFVEHESPDQLIDCFDVDCLPRAGEAVIFQHKGDRSVYRVAAIEHVFTTTYVLETVTVAEVRCRLAMLGDGAVRAPG